MNTILSRTFLFALALGSFALLGCANTVVTGEGFGENGANAQDGCAEGDDCADPGAGGGGAGGGQGSGGASPGVEANAIAMFYGQIPWADPGSGSTSSSSSGGGPSADSLQVWIGGQLLACADPNAMACGSQWTVSFNLPVEVQQPGTYSLADLNGFATETGPGGGEECWWGGGSFWDGTVTIDSVTATEITGTLNPTGSIWDFDATGPFTALRCP